MWLASTITASVVRQRPISDGHTSATAPCHWSRTLSIAMIGPASSRVSRPSSKSVAEVVLVDLPRDGVRHQLVVVHLDTAREMLDPLPDLLRRLPLPPLEVLGYGLTHHLGLLEAARLRRAGQLPGQVPGQ